MKPTEFYIEALRQALSRLLSASYQDGLNDAENEKALRYARIHARATLDLVASEIEEPPVRPSDGKE